MNGGIYDGAMEFIKNSLKNSYSSSLHHSSFFKQLPPKIKQKLIEELLNNYKTSLFYFFNDVTASNFAPSGFVSKVISSLDHNVFLKDQTILHAGRPVTHVFFLYKN